MSGFYVFTKILTFPGGQMRAFWEQVVCRFSKVPVEDNRYFRNDEMCGHIEHEFMPTARSAFALCFVPAFFGGILAFMLAIIPTFISLYLQIGDLTFTILSALSYWFAASIFCNSYPLIEDASNMMNKVYKSGNIFQKIFYAPAALILYIMAYAERYCITFILTVITTLLIVMA